MGNIETEIQAKGLTAPRVTTLDIEDNITSENYFTAAAGVEGWLRFGDPKDSDSAEYPDSLRLLTFCVLVLKNGFTVTGESACASPENFDADLGRKIARQNAVNKIWPLMGYALKQRLHDEQKPTSWVCASCSQVYPDGIPATCGVRAVGCNELLAQGK